MRKPLHAILLAIVLCAPLSLLAQIASWDFAGQNQLATSTATAFDANLTSAPILTRGTGAPASAGGNSFRTVGFKNDGISIANTDYFEVSLSPIAGKRLSLSAIDARFGGTASFYASPGVTSQFAYSLDGTTFNLIGAPVTSTSLTLSTINLSGLSALQNIPSGTTVTFRYYASGQTATGGWGFSSTGTNGFSISGTFTNAVGNTPSLNASVTSFAFPDQNVGTSSAAQSYVLSGTNLTSGFTASTAAPFTVSKDNVTFGSSAVFSAVEAAAPQTVYVKFTPTTGGTSNGNISNTAVNAATIDIPTTGNGIAGTVSTAANNIDFGDQTIGTNSSPQTYTLSGVGLANPVTVSTSAPFSVSKDNITYATSLTFSLVELGTSPTVYVRFSPTNATSTNGIISNSSQNANGSDITVKGTGLNPPAVAAHIVISEIYGGGGNSGATYKNDFIELYNPTDLPVNLTGWSIQYASATGTTWASTPLIGNIPPKGFYLIQEAPGSGGTVNLPTPDAIGTLALSGTTGKLILSNSTALLSGANPSTATVIDKVGFGPTATGYEGTPAPVTSNATAIERKASITSTAATLAVGGTEEFNGNGQDTDVNSADFVVTAPNPQNSTIKEPNGVNHVVISEVFGGGGNSGSVYKNDFIELYNPTSAAVDLTGWSVQYGSATGTTWQVTTLSGSIAPKSFYLVQEAAGTGGTTNLPAPDKSGTIAMAAGAGKVLLANVPTAQTGAFPTGSAIIDFVGFGLTANGFEGTGPTPAPSATVSVERKASATSNATTLGIGGSEEFSGNGYDTDDNSVDFVSKLPTPQNSTITEPALVTGPYLSTNPKTLAFPNQAINNTSPSKSYVLSGGNLTNPITVSVTAPFSISKDNVTFFTAINYTVAELATNQTVYVKFSPTTAGNAAGTITHSSAGATSVNVTLTGAAIDPNQTAFNFENCTVVGSSALSDGFYQYSVAGPQTWGCTTTFGHDAADPTGKASLGNALQINGYASGNIQNEDWLISPALNLSAMNYAVLSFWTRSAFTGDKLQLKVSTNYSGTGDPALATWTTIDGKFPETASDTWIKSDHIDLSPYKALPVYVAIVYNSTTSSASRWTVDDFVVTNSATPPPVDITLSTSALNFGFQTPGTTSTAKTFGFSAGNLKGDVTLTAPASFTISSTSGGTYGNTVTYPKSAINNTSPTVYAKFSPTTANTTYSENVSIASPGSATKTITLSGNTFDTANTLEVVNWNIEWFGSPAQDPSNDVQQAANVKTIVNNINADIYGFAEVVDTTLFRNTVLPAGYNVIFSEFGSYADNKADIDYPLAQKLAFMYRTDQVKPIKTYGVLLDTYKPLDPSTSVDGTPYKNWSSGRFPFAMEAEVTINGKKEVVTFIEIHAKANTGPVADQIDAYNRRKGGNLQLKNWLDANLTGKKVMILGDFNDVLDPDKTIAPMPAGTGTSYSDFTKDASNYFPITLPLSLAGKQSTAGFNTVIDNVIITKSLNDNYIQGTAEVLDAVKNLVTNYNTTTTDHYPIKSRYLFGNGAPTLDAIPNSTVCYQASNQVLEITGISPGPESTQTTALSVSSDNAALFDLLTAQSTGTDKGTITYHLKNNVSGTANITVTVTDNGGTDVGGINTTSKTFTLTVRSLATASITGSTAVPQNATAPFVTFTGANGTAPYTFTYNINGGTNKTITTSTGSSVNVAVPTNMVGSFAYNLVDVADANCSQAQTGVATVLIRPLPVATINGSTAICVNSTTPIITFTGSAGTAPYTFTYSVNGSTNRTITTSTNVATINAPTNTVGTFTYSLVNVADAYGMQLQTGNAVIKVNALPIISISSNVTTVISKGTPIVLMANGAVNYVWSPLTDIIAGQETSTLTVRPKQTTTYIVTGTNGSGCVSTQSITISVEDDYKVKPLNILTPNGDGKNDKFVIENIDYYPNNTLKVFDRSGRIVYSKKGYANEWDGTYNGSALASDTYYYIIDFGTTISSIKGYITLVRN
jgi:gliding motility-associated-like protein